MTAEDTDTSRGHGKSPGWKTWLGRAVLALVSLGLGLLAAEYGMRLLKPLPPEHVWRTYAPDEELLYRLVPNTEKMFRHNEANGGAEISYRVNSRGYRGDELADEQNGPRIMVYGDSFVAAEFSPEEETLTEQLRVRLQRALGEDVECINAGVVGYGPDQVLLRMEQELDELEPDLVVVGLFSGNDYGDLVRNRLFRLSADGNLHRQHVVLAPEMLEAWRQADRSALLSSLTAASQPGNPDQAAGASGSPESRRFVERALASAIQDYYRFVAQDDLVLNQRTSDYYDADVAIDPTGEAPAYKLRLMERVMDGIGRAAARRGIPLVFLIIPAPMDVCDGYVPSVDTTLWPTYQQSRLCGLLADIATRLGLPHVDLFPVFREHDPRSLYFGNKDHHWNAAGQELAAETLAPFILEQGWL